MHLIEIYFDKLSCPYVWYMSIVYFSINRLPNMCFIKFTFKYPWMRKTSMSGFSMLLMTSRKTRRNRRTELSFGLAAPIIMSFPPQRRHIVALRSSSAVLNLFMLSSSGQMVKIRISETDKHKYLLWPSGKLISFLSWQAAATEQAENAELSEFDLSCLRLVSSRQEKTGSNYVYVFWALSSFWAPGNEWGRVVNNLAGRLRSAWGQVIFLLLWSWSELLETRVGFPVLKGIHHGWAPRCCHHSHQVLLWGRS